MDYDTYSANDAIGKVYLDLNPLLVTPGISGIRGIRSDACSVPSSGNNFGSSILTFTTINFSVFLLNRWTCIVRMASSL